MFKVGEEIQTDWGVLPGEPMRPGVIVAEGRPEDVRCWGDGFWVKFGEPVPVNLFGKEFKAKNELFLSPDMIYPLLRAGDAYAVKRLLFHIGEVMDGPPAIGAHYTAMTLFYGQAF